MVTNETTSAGPVVSSGQSLTVSSGQTSTGITVMNGGTLTVANGGTAIGTVDSGSEVVSAGGVDSGATIATNGAQTVLGTANNAVVGVEAFQVVGAGGVANGTTVSGLLADQQILAGGAAIGTIVVGDGNAAYQDVFSGGAASNTTVSSGGTQRNHGTATNTTVLAGGVQFDYATASGTIVDGGTQIVLGVASATTLTNTGKATVSSGGTIVDATVSGPGAVLNLLAGAVVSGAITFGGSGGRLQIGDSVASGTLISGATVFGLAAGDSLDLTAIAFAGSGSAVVVSGGGQSQLQISEGGATYAIALDPAQSFAGRVFRLTQDSGSGTLISETLNTAALGADYNHDGYGDILVRNELTGGLTFAASSGGTFTGVMTPATGGLGNLRYGGHGDINGDGFADLVVQDPASRRLYAALQDGSGTPSWATLAQVPGWTAKGAGDINGDGFADIVIQNDASGIVDYYDVHNSAFVTLTALSGFNVVGVGDINGDGHADIVMQNPASGAIDYLNMAGGVYSGAIGVVSTPGWDVRAVGDLNGDGYADIVIQNSSGQTAFANMSGGAFSGWGTATTGLTADYIVKDAVDVNGDGYADVIVQQASTGLVHIALEGAGGFVQWGAPFNSGLGARGQVAGNGAALTPTAALASDYTGSGTGDVLFRNTTTGQLQFAVMSAGNVTGFGFATGGLGNLAYVGHGDVDGNGIADVVVQDPSSGRLYTALQDGSGSGSPNWQVLPQVPGWTGKAVGDLNGDGYADVVIQNDSNFGIQYYDVHNATFTALSTKNGTVDATGAAVVGVGDVNGDGSADVVLQDPSSSEIYYTSTATGLVDVGNPGAGFQVRAVGDLTGFGFADIAVEDNAGNTKFLNMQGGLLQGFGMATTGLTSDYVLKDAVDVFNNGHAALIVQQVSTGTTFYAAQGTNGFDHWGAPIGSLGPQWQAV